MKISVGDLPDFLATYQEAASVFEEHCCERVAWTLVC